MKKDLENLDFKFWSWFPSGIKDPKRINYFLNQRSKLLDREIIKKFEDFNLQADFSLFAIGGYGNKEIFPSSDIDISILQINSKIKDYSNLEKFVASLWDFGLKVGHSVRTEQDIKKIVTSDIKEFTSYLSLRPLSANKKSLEIIHKIFEKKEKLFPNNKFFIKKKIEQENRYLSFDSTEFNLEPDLKESPGSLRDFQTAAWILDHCFKIKSHSDITNSNIFNTNEFKQLVDAHNFIKLLRYAINLIQTNSRNRLSFNSQIELAKKANIKISKAKQPVEKLMQLYYSNAEKLSIFNETIFDLYEEKNPLRVKRDYGEFFIKNNRIGLKNEDLKNNKHLIFKIFIKLGQRKDITNIDTRTSKILRENILLIDKDFKNDINFSKQFLEILRSPYNLSSILKKMKRLGIIQAYIKEFEEVIGQMQFDLFHVYTVDEHTFKVVRNMRQMKINHIDEGFEIETELINRLPKIEILYLAGLFHDLGKESRNPGTFAANCLLARKLIEKDVKFVQLYHQGWDQHNDLPNAIKVQCKDTDQPTAGLITDLKQRGLLEDTLVIWGGEFGRGSYSQGTLTKDNYGRDHHPKCFTIFMTGAGIKKGITLGSTDDFGYNIKERPVHIHDFQATIMHLLGIDHERLTFKHQGRRYRLTDVHGKVVKEILS